MIMGYQKRINYQSEFDRVQGANRLTALHPDVKSRTKDLQHKARQTLTTVRHMLFTKQHFNLSYHI